MITRLFVTVASIFFFDNSTVNWPPPFTVHGVIKDRATGAAVPYVHIFTVKGEEEDLTNAKGEFEFQTWHQQALLTTEREGYQKAVLKLKLPATKQIILLTKQ